MGDSGLCRPDNREYQAGEYRCIDAEFTGERVLFSFFGCLSLAILLSLQLDGVFVQHSKQPADFFNDLDNFRRQLTRYQDCISISILLDQRERER